MSPTHWVTCVRTHISRKMRRAKKEMPNYNFDTDYRTGAYVGRLAEGRRLGLKEYAQEP